ncbi:type IV pilus assembly protein PilM [Stratiformator vulcanicus]|uniref:Competence protein A n=1 Tax=Stratiformator vulcanicus TaxID=2527980 RepID=A0A517R049_9PLAN|nr:type IV pilus assembly protein PilM [Stratiformator vulcanicus]QDT37269.1 Competence protein A [Stratiformator vulcanicus]
MAEERGCWGIEVGQAGLKAIRLRYAEAAKQVIAVAFDYVPHAKLLSQPDAVPEELIPQAIETFLARNDIRGDSIAIAAPGHSALARFIQLPPVETSKVAQIVQYEAKQQIPFALDEVIWDYQTLGGAAEESGYILEAEVGLFAMKRDLVEKTIKPFLDRKVEVQLVQISPLALFNFVTFDRLGIRPGEEIEVDDDEHIVVCDMGADQTMLVVTNGKKIWIRNVPIGGNHFTRALVKGMKLTFAKAEHLKCNATKSPDPRAVFQALRPVFNDYVAELQRSIGYFSSVNRSAKIVKLLGAGNGFKLAGLQKFLQQNLQYDVERIETFDAAVGDKVLDDDLFKDNVLSFVVPYGLALQAMDQTTIRTTLLPPEIALAREIRRKKPWGVAAAAVLLLAFGVSAIGFGNVMQSVSEARWKSTETNVSQHNSTVDSLKQTYQGKETEYADIVDRGNRLLGNIERRDYWLEVYRAVNACLPRDTGDRLDLTDVTSQRRIRINSITAQRLESFAEWFGSLPQQTKTHMLKGDQAAAPAGAGYLFTLTGEHFHDTSDEATDPLDRVNRRRTGFVLRNFVDPLNEFQVTVVDDVDKDGLEEELVVPVRQIGISHATMTDQGYEQVRHPKAILAERSKARAPSRSGPGGIPGLGGLGNSFAGRPDNNFGNTNRGNPPAGTDPNNTDPTDKPIYRTTFTIQFCWTPTPEDTRPAEAPEAADAAGVEGETEGGAETPPQES